LRGADELLDVVGEVVEPLPVAYVALQGYLGAELLSALSLRVVLVELVAEDAPQLRRVALRRDVKLDDFEDARLVLKAEAAARRGALAELFQLPEAPLGLDVARREDGDEEGDFREACYERVREDVVALKLAVAPDADRLARELL
jgi:hypothetical protein